MCDALIKSIEYLRSNITAPPNMCKASWHIRCYFMALHRFGLAHERGRGSGNSGFFDKREKDVIEMNYRGEHHQRKAWMTANELHNAEASTPGRPVASSSTTRHRITQQQRPSTPSFVRPPVCHLFIEPTRCGIGITLLRDADNAMDLHVHSSHLAAMKMAHSCKSIDETA
jgi:hypothetical protein